MLHDKSIEENGGIGIAHIFEEYYLQLISYARKYVAATTAEDIVQDIFVDIHRRFDQLNIQVGIKNYLFRAVHNRCLDHLKHEMVRKRYVNHALMDLSLRELNYFEPEKGNSSLIINNDLQAVHRAIEQLPPRCREIIQLRYFSELDTKEIAKQMNISCRTVETQLYKAVKQIRGMVRKLSYLSFTLF